MYTKKEGMSGEGGSEKTEDEKQKKNKKLRGSR